MGLRVSSVRREEKESGGWIGMANEVNGVRPPERGLSRSQNAPTPTGEKKVQGGTNYK